MVSASTAESQVPTKEDKLLRTRNIYTLATGLVACIESKIMSLQQLVKDYPSVHNCVLSYKI